MLLSLAERRRDLRSFLPRRLPRHWLSAGEGCLALRVLVGRVVLLPNHGGLHGVGRGGDHRGVGGLEGQLLVDGDVEETGGLQRQLVRLIRLALVPNAHTAALACSRGEEIRILTAKLLSML